MSEKQIPESWVEVPLKDVCDVLDGRRVPVNSNDRAKRVGKIPYYGATGQVGTIDDYLFDEELLLLGEDGAPFFDNLKPISYLIKGKSWVNNHAYVLRASPETTSNSFLKYFLNQFDFTGYVNGTTRLKLTQEAMNRIPVPLPPLAEQRRIVVKLDEVMGKIETARARLERVPRVLKRFRQSVLAAACSGRLTADWRAENNAVGASELVPTIAESEGFPELPEQWRWVALGAACDVVTGNTPSKNDPLNYSDKETECPFFKPTDLGSGRNVSKARQFISKQGERGTRILPPSSVAVTCIGATLGKTGFIVRRGATNQQINSVLPSPHFDPLFVFFYCNSSYFQTRIWAESSSTTLPIINKGRFEQLEIPLPSIEEQREIVRRVEALFALADSLDARHIKGKRHFDRLPASVLAKAFRGELVPQNPDDEDAQLLLERLRAARETAPAKRTRAPKTAAKQLQLAIE